MTVPSFVAAFKRLRLNQPVVSPVYDRYSVLAVMEGISHHGWEYYTEERRSENTVLFYAVRYWKVFWLVSVMSRTLTIMPSWNCGTFVMNLLDRQTSPLSSTSRLCLPYRRPWSGQQRSQRGRYSTHGIFYLQSSWKLWSVCNITGEGWTESLLLVEVCAVFP